MASSPPKSSPAVEQHAADVPKASEGSCPGDAVAVLLLVIASDGGLRRSLSGASESWTALLEYHVDGQDDGAGEESIFAVRRALGSEIQNPAVCWAVATTFSRAVPADVVANLCDSILPFLGVEVEIKDVVAVVEPFELGDVDRLEDAFAVFFHDKVSPLELGSFVGLWDDLRRRFSLCPGSEGESEYEWREEPEDELEGEDEDDSTPVEV